jgi:hypothetical protein
MSITRIIIASAFALLGICFLLVARVDAHARRREMEERKEEVKRATDCTKN